MENLDRFGRNLTYNAAAAADVLMQTSDDLRERPMSMTSRSAVARLAARKARDNRSE